MGKMEIINNKLAREIYRKGEIDNSLNCVVYNRGVELYNYNGKKYLVAFKAKSNISIEPDFATLSVIEVNSYIEDRIDELKDNGDVYNCRAVNVLFKEFFEEDEDSCCSFSFSENV